jgi:hypothetical protein
MFQTNTGLSGTRPSWLTVELDGDAIAVQVRRGVTQHLSSTFLRDANGVGLIAFADATQPARCAAFSTISASS